MGASRADPSHGDSGRRWSRSRCPLAEKPPRTRLRLNPAESLMAEWSDLLHVVKKENKLKANRRRSDSQLMVFRLSCLGEGEGEAVYSIAEDVESFVSWLELQSGALVSTRRGMGTPLWGFL